MIENIEKKQRNEVIPIANVFDYELVDHKAFCENKINAYRDLINKLEEFAEIACSLKK